MYYIFHSFIFFFKSDIDENRLTVAKQIGADHVVKVTSRDPKVTAQAIEEALGDKADITIECSGAAPSIQTAVYVSMNCFCTYILQEMFSVTSVMNYIMC